MDDNDLSRRRFVKGVGAGLIALQLPGCSSGGPEGPGSDGGELPDLAKGGGPPDLGMARCPASFAVDAGAASGVAANSAKLNTQDTPLFVCRDAKGLYGMTAVCTHQGATVRFVSAAQGFLCPLHQSQYTFNGAVTRGPATAPLDHLALCVDEKGHARVDVNQTVSASTRT